MVREHLEQVSSAESRACKDDAPTVNCDARGC